MCVHLPDVITDTGIEENRVLRHYTDGLPQTALCHIPDVLPVNQNSAFALFEVIESVEKPQDRRFTGTRLANKGNGRAFWDFEGNPIQSSSSVII